MRTIPILAITAVSGALFAASTHSTAYAPRAPGYPAAASSTVSESELRLRQQMRRFWTDHVVWTRDYIIAAVGDQPDQEAAAKRLMKNQEDIGNSIATFYGKQAGGELTRLLKDHIQLAVELIKAAKAKDTRKYDEIGVNWQKNGEDIAEFLSRANPNWTKVAMVEMMRVHLTGTTNEVKARLEKKWNDDVKTFDEVYDHILKMADALSEGIIKQFPDKFSGA